MPYPHSYSERVRHASVALGLAATLTTSTAWPASIGDINGDGNDDILLRSNDGRWLYNAMDGRLRILSLSGSADLPSDWSWRYQGMGDFDGDGDDDVLLRHDNGRWYVYAMDGRDAPDQGVRLAMSVNPDWQLAAIGDFNGDATDDVLLRNRRNGRWYFYPIEDGAVSPGRGAAIMTSSRNWTLAAVGDLNNDGNDDVLLRHENGRWWYYPMNGRRHIVADRGFVDIETSEEWRIAGIGNFDGDGGDEILLRHDDGRWQHYAMDGRMHIPDDAGPARITRNDDFHFAGIGDLNGDGNDDVLLRRDSSGHWYYYPMAGRDFIAGRGTTNVTAQRRWNMADLATGWEPGEFYVDDGTVPFAQREYNVRFKDYCAVPRTGVDAEGNPFPDRQGSTWDENNWLRSWSNDTYLWYAEIEDVDPGCCDTPTYFDLQKTQATTPSGKFKDQFHFTQNTAEYRARVSTGAVGAGYGANFAVLSPRPPREIRVRFTEPNSPATQPGVDLARGAEMLEVDGVDVVNGPTQADVDVINAGLWPQNLNETHQFLVRDLDGTERTITMTSANITTSPVQHDRIIETDTGPVGYMLFKTFGVQTAEGQLVDAFTRFEDAGVTDLVLDMRYNGGGFIILANQLSYMIAGDHARGRVFNQSQFNDKHRVFNPVTGARLQPDIFRTTTIGWTTPRAGIPLPELDLERVFVLSSSWTCSASELVVNALRGIDVEVILVGETTCGKPYGFYSTDNCGTTYSTVQIRAVNAKNFGDYPDGFSPENLWVVEGIPVPGCVVADDFEHGFGDPDEARVAAALRYRQSGACPTPSSVAALSVARQQDTGAALVEPQPDIGYMIATEVPD